MCFVVKIQNMNKKSGLFCATLCIHSHQVAHIIIVIFKTKTYKGIGYGACPLPNKFLKKQKTRLLKNNKDKNELESVTIQT